MRGPTKAQPRSRVGSSGPGVTVDRSVGTGATHPRKELWVHKLMSRMSRGCNSIRFCRARCPDSRRPVPALSGRRCNAATTSYIQHYDEKSNRFAAKSAFVEHGWLESWRKSRIRSENYSFFSYIALSEWSSVSSPARPCPSARPACPPWSVPGSSVSCLSWSCPFGPRLIRGWIRHSRRRSTSVRSTVGRGRLRALRCIVDGGEGNRICTTHEIQSIR